MIDIGSLVECIADSWQKRPDNNGLTPKKGEVYTVRGIKEHLNGDVGLHLEEIVLPPFCYLDGTKEPTWAIGAFRELDVPSPLQVEELVEESCCVPVNLLQNNSV